MKGRIDIKNLAVVIMLFISVGSVSKPQVFETYKEQKKNYVQLNGDLFKDIRLSGVFKDSKTFVDAIPLKAPEVIRHMYDSLKALPDFDLSQFVYANFKIPGGSADTIKVPEGLSMDDHLEALWHHLVRDADSGKSAESTLLPLKYSYIVPGGRFREIYYWDSFFTILGLLADDKVEIAENMVFNFAYMLDKYKMIPNGNRAYYLTRSQPPFFALMVDAICRYRNDYNWGLQFLPQLEVEYNFWMNGLEKLSSENPVAERVVNLGENNILNRYYDFDTIPREESYKEDYNLGQNFPENKRAQFYRNLRAAAESGWDFSSRWFADQKSLSAIETTDIIPVDLNCLLYFLEDRISFFNKLKGDNQKSELFAEKASARKNLINEIFWNEEVGFYFDYNWLKNEHTMVYSLAGCFPLYFGIADEPKAEAAAEKLEKIFLKQGGLLTTPNNTGQQWDAPNGWAPLQWMAVKGLREYKINTLADTIKSRWLNLNRNVYKRTGRMVEKYNVVDISLFAGGGEYDLQDGFGWTNGVAAAFISDFDKIFLHTSPALKEMR